MALLKFKRSAVPGKVPTLADLSLGELAINTFDGKVYIRKDSGTASIVEVGGGSGVLSFNSRTGAVTLTSADVTTALGGVLANGLGSVGAPSYTFAGDLNTGMWSPAADTIAFSEGGVEAMRIDSSANVGIGTSSPGARVHSYISGSANLLRLERAENNGVYARWTRPNKSYILALDINNNGGNDFTLFDETAGASRLTVDNSGNVGLGVTPSAWQIGRALQIGTAGDAALLGFNNNSYLTANANYSSGAWRYTASAAALMYQMAGGVHSWHTAASGTAGNATGFTQAMTLDASGNLLVGTTTTAYGTAGRGLIEVNGSSTALIAIKTGDTARGYFAASSSATELSAVGASQPLLFTTNSAERARITTDGSMQLSVGGVSNTHQFLYNESGGEIQLSDATGNGPILIDNSGGLARFYKVGTGSMAVGTTGTGALLFTANNAERMRIDSAGSVGIGTTSPNARLHVAAATANTPLIIRAQQNSSGNSFDYAAMAVNATGANGGIVAWATGAIRGGSVWVQTDNAAPLILGTNDTERMRIGSGGEVTANVDIRAPIFYDSNNTAFYLDPAGNSILSTLRASNIQFPSGTVAINLDNSSYQLLRDPTGNIALYLGGADPANYYDNTTHWFRNRAGSNVAYINASGIYAPVFYDFSNSGFYVDPASGSRLGGQVTFNGGTNIASNGDVYARRDSGATGVYYFADGGSKFLFWDGTRYLFGSAGPVDAAVSYRAPFFYDLDNTGYYIDPASTSVMFNFLNINQRVAYDRSWDNFPSISVVNTTDQGPQGDFRIHGIGGANGGDFSVRLLVDGTIQSLSDVRAPIFYDSNNTGYYVDPNSGSKLFDLNVEGTGNKYLQIWSTTANEAMVRYIGGSGSGWYVGKRTAAQLVGTGDFHFFAENPGATVAGIDTAGNIFASGSVRAPIFYDSNNTARYLDPTGSSFIQGNFYVVRDGNSNDAFGGLEIRENSFQGAGTGAATEAPGINFHWSARAAARLYMNSGGSFVLGGQGDITNNRRSLFINELFATGNVTAYFSDERLKTRQGNIQNALQIVSKLNGFRYTNNDLAKSFGYEGDQVQLGVSAQEVEAVLPEIVCQAAFDIDSDDPNSGSKSGENYKTVQYDRLVPLLIEAIKELTARVAELEGK